MLGDQVLNMDAAGATVSEMQRYRESGDVGAYPVKRSNNSSSKLAQVITHERQSSC
jgi:hypothetical protein